MGVTFVTHLQALRQRGVSEVIVNFSPSKIPNVPSGELFRVKFSISVASTKYLHCNLVQCCAHGKVRCNAPFGKESAPQMTAPIRVE